MDLKLYQKLKDRHVFIELSYFFRKNKLPSWSSKWLCIISWTNDIMSITDFHRTIMHLFESFVLNSSKTELNPTMFHFYECSIIVSFISVVLILLLIHTTNNNHLPMNWLHDILLTNRLGKSLTSSSCFGWHFTADSEKVTGRTSLRFGFKNTWTSLPDGPVVS